MIVSGDANAGRRGEAAKDRPSLVIADDHPIFRTGLKWALEQSGEIGAVHDVGSYAELKSALAASAFDIVVVDLHMPGFVIPDGLRALRLHFPRTPILVLSASSETDDLIRALRAGASGYITKASDIPALIEAMRVVLSGGVFLPADLLPGSVEAIGSSAQSSPTAAPRLTRRQFEVMTLTLRGHVNKQIAYQLSMSEGTVKTHLAAIMRAYGVNNRVQLLREVERIGYQS